MNNIFIHHLNSIFMSIKKFTLLLLSLLLVINLTAQVQTFRLDISGGAFMGSPIPDYTQWYYFSFEQGDTIGASAGVLENVNGGQIGTEVIDAAWKARTDWDIAFHATDIRTNSGASGNGASASLFIADTLSVTPLEDVFSNLNEAPAEGYAADEILSGTFIFGMTSMPPLRTTQLSASKAAQGWAVFGMGASGENPKVIVFKTATGKYAKVYLKQFIEKEEEKPGYIEFDYVYQPDGSRDFTTATGISHATPATIAVYPNPVSDILHVAVSEKSDIVIYNLTGTIVKQRKAQTGTVSIPVSDLGKGSYVVRVNSNATSQVQKVIVR
ncbi:hypothetical protein FACS189440_15820 [Bacteroidia bacterium]|nr:hypothetical protein FACS189423_01290 [Bacteroidia bacterium]GHT49685.1 hypothetical protein FACS189440_15820 [Bacteroidia bacterium]